MKKIQILKYVGAFLGGAILTDWVRKIPAVGKFIPRV